MPSFPVPASVIPIVAAFGIQGRFGALIYISALADSPSTFGFEFNEAAPMFGTMRDMMATGHMGWTMGGGMVLLAVLLILGVIALFKYIAFR